MSDNQTTLATGLRKAQPSTLVELAAGLLLLALLVEGLLLWLAAPQGLRLSAAGVYLTMAALVLWAWPPARRWLGWANRITLLRGMLIAILAGAVIFPDFMAHHATDMAILAVLALGLDGLDGWVARVTRSASAFGARFDMELDAFFILVLCAALVAVDKAGAWVLAIGLMRYAFVLAGYIWPWLARPLPESRRRKAICVWQIVSLLLGLLPMVAEGLASLLAILALGLLTLSFGLDVRWLARRNSLPAAS
ncbi:Phosphatidylglycerophosphate synthase [Modicisalibacter muralis]|uniref:Phosphatidylglycerophosphate synthase n=1 Tax=Modicisalibacter muralis TaxID=119000 RepID=A0A1G9EMB0_9GAMM|nr:CDP-alcohol phosphatidyltransferase family protein [Halomonas muralis]SDK77244.1 Phosphatidylglycerophosphate synthase [Halomonas muralis]